MERNELQAVLAEGVQTLIVQGQRRISARLDLTRVQILGLIAEEGPIRPTTIATRLQLTKSTISRHLTALQEAGQIQVRGDAADARTFLAEITPAGQRDREVTAAVGVAQFGRAISHWSDSQVDEAHRVIQRLLQAWAPADAPDRIPIASGDLGPSGPRWMARRIADDPDDRSTPVKGHAR